MSALNLQPGDIYVDFVTQNPVYEYDAQGKTAKENLAGYQTKKNISVRFKTESALRQITNAANRAGIYDLIKVDYVIGSQQDLKMRLMEEASKVIKRKEEMGSLLGIKLKRWRWSRPATRYLRRTSFTKRMRRMKRAIRAGIRKWSKNANPPHRITRRWTRTILTFR